MIWSEKMTEEQEERGYKPKIPILIPASDERAKLIERSVPTVSPPAPLFACRCIMLTVTVVSHRSSMAAAARALRRRSRRLSLRCQHHYLAPPRYRNL